MHLLVISPHSYVDLITNSSSELFVCTSKKSVETVEAILRKLLDTHNELGDSGCSFGSAFRDLEVAEYTFDYSSLPANLLEEYEKYHDAPNRNYWTNDTSYMSSPEYERLRANESKMERELGLGGAASSKLYTEDPVEYDRLNQIRSVKRNKIWKDWNTKAFASEVAIFRHFCAENGVTIPKDFSKALDSHDGSWFHWKGEAFVPWNAFRELIGWGISVKKGDILVYSRSDNTIPSLMFDSIESYLGATRYHLG